MDDTLEILEDLEDDLLARAFLFDHPTAYREGVEATLEALRAILASHRVVA